MWSLAIAFAVGIAVRHFWTPIRVWLVHSAWPWLHGSAWSWFRTTVLRRP